MYSDSPKWANGMCIFIPPLYDLRSYYHSLEKAFTTSPNNRGILELIIVLEEIMDENPELEEECGKEVISSWVHKQRDTTLRNLRKIDKDDVAIVVHSAISHGGSVFLKEWFVPILTYVPGCLLTLSQSVWHHNF